MPGPFESFYRSDLQSLYALCVVPLGFLARLALRGHEPGSGVEPAAARFVRLWAIAFAIQTVLDPVATGPVSRWLADPQAATWLLLGFVLLGDFRVFLLVFHVAEPGLGAGAAAARAALWTLLVPVVAGSANALLAHAAGPLPDLVLWILYEVSFLALARELRERWVPSRVVAERPAVRAYLERVLDYVSLYYALWAAADATILFAGVDAGWGLRVIPNLLYYGLWVPFAYFLFFRGRFGGG